ncbi:hypothetical protein Anas_04329 [Armadillidium nasatum]|uniref:Uncharacterized protein n=1 Tax=Armadillidium nasatum TaxID=96803 RepID=A0A5N5SWR8_9CRUS|nr:hypothetical protein Anas_04329 [Armadillidium nasatum]
MRVFIRFIIQAALLMMILTSVISEECVSNSEEEGLCSEKYWCRISCFRHPCPDTWCRIRVERCMKCMCEHHDINKC